MTLIELMVALGVATLVFTAALSLYLVVSRSLRRPVEHSREQACLVLEQLRDELVTCAQSVSTSMPAFVLDCPVHDTNTPGLATLAFTVGRIPAPDEDFARLEIDRIQYGVIPGTGGAGRLMRESMTLWGTEALSPAISNSVMDDIVGFDVLAKSGSNWTNTWTSSARTLFPGALRIRLDWRVGSTAETATVDVFIPAGNSISGQKAK